MATQAAAMRAKLFGGGGASGLSMTAAAGPHTTEALRQATDRLLREQSASGLAVTLYRQKLGEAQAAVKKLETAYVLQNSMNQKLQARVKTDYTTLSQLSQAVTTANTAYTELSAEHRQLALEQKEAELDRASLAADFAKKASMLADLDGKFQAACDYGKDLQGRLDDAAAVRDTLVEQVAALKAELADKAKLQAATQQHATQLDADLMSVRQERDRLGADLAALRDDIAVAETARQQAAAHFAAQMAGCASQIGQLQAELSTKSTQLAEAHDSKAALEAVIKDQEAAAQRLAADITQMKEAAQTAEAEHVVALEAKSIELQELAGQHATDMESKLAELTAVSEAKEELAVELATCKEVLEKLATEHSSMLEENGAAEGEQQAQLAALTGQLAALTEHLAAAQQQHGKAIKALQDKHTKESEIFVERTSKKIEGTMQEQRKVQAELVEMRKKAETAQAEAGELRKKIAEQEAGAKGKERSLEEEKGKALAEAARAAKALQASDTRVKAAEELAAERTSKLDEQASKMEEQAAELKSKEEENKKLDLENAANLLKLDNSNESLSKCQEKLEGFEAQNGQLAKTISSKDRAVAEKEAALSEALDRIEVLEKEVKVKSDMLKGISQVAAHMAGGSADAPAGRTDGRGRAAAGGTQRAAAGANRPVKKVSIKEPTVSLRADSEDEEESSGSEDEAIDEPNPHQALVPAGGKTQPERCPAQRPSQRATQRASQQVPSRPIITEVDSGDEEEEEEIERQPSQKQPTQRQAAQKQQTQQQRHQAAVPAVQDDDEEEDRQTRGRKRSGRAVASKPAAAAAKKPRAMPAASGMRHGLFSMQTASQNVSMEGTKANKSGKATATSAGHRKQMAGAGGDRGGKNNVAKKKQPAAVTNVFGDQIFGAFGGYGGGFSFDDLSP